MWRTWPLVEGQGLPEVQRSFQGQQEKEVRKEDEQEEEEEEQEESCGQEAILAHVQKEEKKTQHAHVSYAASQQGIDLPYAALVDTACAKSVMGDEEAQMLIEAFRADGWPVKVVDDTEPFRFGPGKRIWSEKAVVFVVVWGGKVVLLQISILKAKIPPLLSMSSSVLAQ